MESIQWSQPIFHLAFYFFVLFLRRLASSYCQNNIFRAPEETKDIL